MSSKKPKKPQISFSIDSKNELYVKIDIDWSSETIVDDLGVLLSYVFFSENQDMIYAILTKSAETAGKEQEFMDIMENLSYIEDNLGNMKGPNQTNESIVRPTNAPWFMS